jgi:hypothetical protein
MMAPKVPKGGTGKGIKNGRLTLTPYRRPMKKWPISWASKMAMIEREYQKPPIKNVESRVRRKSKMWIKALFPDNLIASP